MTKIKLCGLTRPRDIQAANELRPEYVGFVFAPKSRRYLPPEKAAKLKALLSPYISAVGVFVNDVPETVADLANRQIIDIIQLHGQEDESYIKRLRVLTCAPIIQAFRVRDGHDVHTASGSVADYILLDSGEGGTGTTFDWTLPGKMTSFGRPFFLAGGLDAENVKSAVTLLAPYAVDVSSNIETGGKKDPQKMREFVHAVRDIENRTYTKIKPI